MIAMNKMFDFVPKVKYKIQLLHPADGDPADKDLTDADPCAPVAAQQELLCLATDAEGVRVIEVLFFDAMALI